MWGRDLCGVALVVACHPSFIPVKNSSRPEKKGGYATSNNDAFTREKHMSITEEVLKHPWTGENKSCWSVEENFIVGRATSNGNCT